MLTNTPTPNKRIEKTIHDFDTFKKLIDLGKYSPDLDFHLDFYNTLIPKFPVSMGESIANILKTTADLQVLSLRLRDDPLDPGIVKHLSTLLDSPHCPQHLCLGKLSDEAVKLVAQALIHPNCRENLSLTLSFQTSSALQFLSTALKNHPNPKPVELILFYDGQGINYERDLHAAICAKPYRVKLYPSYRNTDPLALKEMCTALAQGEIPPHTNFNFNIYRGEGMGDAGAIQIAAALKSKLCPQDLTFSFINNGISDTGLQAIADALPFAPSNLSLDFSANGITTTGAIYLATKLKQPTNPQLGIELNGNEIEPKALPHFLDALKTNTSVTRLNGLCADEKSEHCLEMIVYCLNRNQLLAKYPAFDTLIKKISHDNKLYDPVTPPLSLKTSSALVSIFTKVTNQSLPLEIIEYRKALSAVKTVLDRKIEKIKPKLG
jgi:hypothetical protein